MSKTLTSKKFKLTRSTRNTHLFMELDEHGDPVENMREGDIGQCYIKKTVLERNDVPADAEITITISVDD